MFTAGEAVMWSMRSAEESAGPCAGPVVVEGAAWTEKEAEAAEAGGGLRQLEAR